MKAKKKPKRESESMDQFLIDKIIQITKIMNWCTVFEEDREHIRGVIIGTPEFISDVVGRRSRAEGSH